MQNLHVHIQFQHFEITKRLSWSYKHHVVSRMARDKATSMLLAAPPTSNKVLVSNANGSQAIRSHRFNNTLHHGFLILLTEGNWISVLVEDIRAPITHVTRTHWTHPSHWNARCHHGLFSYHLNHIQRSHTHPSHRTSHVSKTKYIRNALSLLSNVTRLILVWAMWNTATKLNHQHH